jgi:hypothetical protein
MGPGTGPWSTGIIRRFVKGLFAGFALGSVYFVTLNALGFFLLPVFGPTPTNFEALYRRMMWRAGPVAMSIATGLFFPLFSWAARLQRSPEAATADGLS